MSSATHAHGAEVLAEHGGDPTRSQTLRRRYAQRLRGQFDALRAAINDGVGQRDVFGLASELPPLMRAESLQPRPPRDLRDDTFSFTTDDQKIERFMAWLRRQERRGVLEVIGSGDNQFVRAAYGKGLRHADAALNAEGLTVPDEELAALFNAPVHRDALQALFTRNFNELQGITEVMNQQISRELTDGFSRGLGPREMARNLTDRVEKIGKTRATTLARTETIRAHSTATLNRYEQMGVEAVTIEAEWLTAGDDRVCPICINLAGETWTIEEARSETITLGPDDVRPHVAEGRSLSSFTGEFPVQPPAHPLCRCSFIPSLT